MMKTKQLLFILLFLLSLSASGQQETPANGNAWTLKQCIEYALNNSLTIQRSSYNMETSEVDYYQSKMALLPTLNAGVNFGYNWGRSVNPVTNLFTTQEINSLSPGLSSSVTLFNGLRLQSVLKQGSRNYQASVEDLQKQK